MNLGEALDTFTPSADLHDIELFNEQYPSLTSFSLFNRTWQLRPYALCVVIAVLCGLILLGLTSRRVRLKKGSVGTMAVLMLPLGLIFAHVFYVLASWAWFEYVGFDRAFLLWEGGYAMWGAIAGVALALLLASRILHERFSALADLCAAPMALVIALCRFAAYPFSGEGKGRLIEMETVLARFPFAVQDDTGNWYWAVFILEGTVALVIMLVLLLSRRGNGDKARLFLILYGASQILCESLHGEDGKMLWHEFIRVPEITSAFVLAVLAVFGVIRRSRKTASDRLPTWRITELLLLFVHGVGLALAMEFAKEKVPVLPVWACYVIMTDGCVMIAYAACRLALTSRIAQEKEASRL